MIAPPGVRASSPELHRRASSVSSSSSQAPPGPEWRKRRSRRAIQRMHMRNRANRKLERRALRDSGIALSAIVDSRGYSMRPPRMPRSPTAGVSNTVCVTISAQGGPVWTKAAEELSEFGEIARLDVSLSITLGTVLVTYFDVRCAQMALLSMASFAAPFPQAEQDCRIVLVDVPSLCQKLGRTTGFQDFGEVAQVDIVAGQSVVEFYDCRSAQALLAAAGDCATPLPASAVLPSTRPPKDASGHLPAPQRGRACDVAGRREAQDFEKEWKFGVDPGAILRGEDKRTTVMVKNLYAAEKGKGLSRQGLLLLLDRCGLGGRYSFFYMPCNEKKGEHGLPGFAFVNFLSPSDVHSLHGAVAGGLWREVCGSSPAKPPALSYAHFQGHEAMVLHFSLSSAFQWPDPEKRPILRPEVLRESAGVDDQTRISKASRSERCKGGSTTGDAGTLSSASSDAGRSSDWPASLPRELAPRELAEPSRPPPPAPADAPAARPVPGLGEGRRGAPAATASAGEEPTAAARTPLRRQAAAFVPAGAATAREPAAQGAQGQVASKKRTTVIMSNMPLSFTQEDLFVLLDSEGFLHKVDFLYLPINLTTMFGIGCAIVNLTTREHAKEFARVFDGFSDWGSESSPACRVRWSEVQGRAANMQRLQNSPVMSASVPSSCKPLLLEDGLLIPFPGPVQASCTELNKTRNLKTV